MQEHLVVTLDGTDYLVEPGTNLLEFIGLEILSFQRFATMNRWGQFKHAIHVWLKLMEKLRVHVAQQ